MKTLAQNRSSPAGRLLQQHIQQQAIAQVFNPCSLASLESQNVINMQILRNTFRPVKRFFRTASFWTLRTVIMEIWATHRRARGKSPNKGREDGGPAKLSRRRT